MYIYRMYFLGSLLIIINFMTGCSEDAVSGLTRGCPEFEFRMRRPGGFPERALSMIVPYGKQGPSGQVAFAMAKAVSGLTSVDINRYHYPGGKGTIGMKVYMSIATNEDGPDGYTVLEHTDEALSAHALDSSQPNPAVDLIPLVISQVSFLQIYIRTNETRYTDWPSFVEWVKAQDGKSSIANDSSEESTERVIMKLITEGSNMEIQQIPFNKRAPRVGALIGGRVDALIEQPNDVNKYLEKRLLKPILTVFNERPASFGNVPTHREMGMNFEPLLKFIGFYVHKDAPADRVEWLKSVFQRAYCQDSYQAFNKSKFMTLIDSYRDTNDAIDMINEAIVQYRDVYKKMGLDVQ